MHTLRKAKLSFGMVTIDTNVASAVKDSDVHLARLHDTCKTRLGKPYYCPTCKEVVEPEHQIQAWPMEGGEMIELSRDDLDSVLPEISGSIELKKFISSIELNELIKRQAYWLAPAQGKESQKGYALLWHAMVETGDVGLGVTTLWGKEHPVSIQAVEQGLQMWLLSQQDDVILPDFVIPSVDSKELEQAEMLLTAYQGGLAATDFQRPARERLNALIESKLKGQKPQPITQSTPSSVPDVMEAIRESLKQAPKRSARTRAAVKA